MRYRIMVLTLTLLCAGSALSQQHDYQQKKSSYVIMPSENILLVIASQPDCPLQIESAKLLININRGYPPLYQYQLRNKGAKPISNYTFGVWTSYGTGSTLSSGDLSGELIMSGQVKPEAKDSQIEIVPLTDDLRNKLKLQASMKSIVVLIVEHITFVDGSTYNGQTLSKALRDYFEDINSEVINSKASP